MKILVYLTSFFFIVLSCSKKKVNPNENNNTTNENIVTTWAHTFQPATLNCSLGDTVFFDLGGSHNAIEVSEANYNTNEPIPIENGFEFGYGESSFFIPLEAKTYYYVCVPHLPEMKAKIVVE